MQLSDWLAVAAIGVAVIAIPATMWATRRWGNERQRLVFGFESIPLLERWPRNTRNQVRIIFADHEIHDPHLLMISLHNIGPADISSDHFDRGRNIYINLTNCEVFLLMSSTHPDDTLIFPGDRGQVGLHPILLKRKDSWRVEVIVAGSPIPVPEFPLIDTDILDRATINANLARSFALRVLRVIGPVIPGAGAILSAIDALPQGDSGRTDLGEDRGEGRAPDQLA